MNVKNNARLEFLGIAENVSFARSCIGAFAAQLDCTLEDIEEIKLVVSEAVSNSIIHGYGGSREGKVTIEASLYDNRTIEITVIDYGLGISDLEQAMKPSYSSDPARMGLGFTFMKSFMDEMEVISKPNEGTSVRLKRSFLMREQQAYA